MVQIRASSVTLSKSEFQQWQIKKQLEIGGATDLCSRPLGRYTPQEGCC